MSIEMLFLDFPIEPPLRFPLLLIEGILTLMLFEFSLMHILRYRNQKIRKDIKDLQELGYFALFFGFSIMWFLFIISDYYFSSTESFSPFLIWAKGNGFLVIRNCGYFSLMIGAFVCVFYLEKYKIYLVRKFFFSIGFLILLSCFTIMFFIDINLT